MATLTENERRKFELGDLEDYPVIASDIIYEGAAVGENASGYARPLEAADPFLGFADAKADNASGAAGDINVSCRQRGKVQLSVSGLAITANDRVAIYASDDDTFTTTAGSNTLIGYVSRFVSSGVGIVEFDTAYQKMA